VNVGHIFVDTVISNPDRPEYRVKSRALIDTGATYTMIPKRLSEELKLRVEGRAVKTAKGVDTLSESYVKIAIGERSGVSTVLVSDTLDQVLIGVVTLEIIGYAVDPTTGQLKEAEALLL